MDVSRFSDTKDENLLNKDIVKSLNEMHQNLNHLSKKEIVVLFRNKLLNQSIRKIRLKRMPIGKDNIPKRNILKN